MKKAFLKKTMSAVVVAATITTLLPLGVSAQWRLNADRTWCYTEGRTLARGWRNISNEWYYFYSNGIMKTGWLYDKGTWYYLDSSGEMKTGWINIGGAWYYFYGTGAMKTGWLKDNGQWYYLDYNEGMLTGTVNIDGKIYYFDGSGKLQTSSNATSTGSNVDVNALPKLPQNYLISIQSAAENRIFQLMNQTRSEAGLRPLTTDSTLLQVARYKSNHMIQYNYFDHTTPQGNKWTSWLKTIGYKYTTTGENIAYNTYDSVELFNQWWNSSGHRANMMNASYTKVGVGVVYGNGKYMGTQTFSN